MSRCGSICHSGSGASPIQRSHCAANENQVAIDAAPELGGTEAAQLYAKTGRAMSNGSRASVGSSPTGMARLPHGSHRQGASRAQRVPAPSSSKATPRNEKSIANALPPSHPHTHARPSADRNTRALPPRTVANEELLRRTDFEMRQHAHVGRTTACE